MAEVYDYIDQQDAGRREVMRYLHELFTNHLDLQDKIRFKIPFYYGKSWVCYLNPVKDDGVELVFLRGNELSNHQGLLESKGRKQVMGLTLYDYRDIPRDLLMEVVQEALLLDEVVPYKPPSKKDK